jgi:hypothetical protein
MKRNSRWSMVEILMVMVTTFAAVQTPLQKLATNLVRKWARTRRNKSYSSLMKTGPGWIWSIKAIEFQIKSI